MKLITGGRVLKPSEMRTLKGAGCACGCSAGFPSASIAQYGLTHGGHCYCGCVGQEYFASIDQGAAIYNP